MSIEDDIKARMGWQQKLAALVLVPWLKENGMDLIGGIIKNVFAQKGWQTSILGGGLLVIAAFVQFYCATDVATGGWIDPQCAYYVKVGLWLGGLGHLLAPGFTASIEKK